MRPIEFPEGKDFEEIQNNFIHTQKYIEARTRFQKEEAVGHNPVKRLCVTNKEWNLYAKCSGSLGMNGDARVAQVQQILTQAYNIRRSTAQIRAHRKIIAADLPRYYFEDWDQSNIIILEFYDIEYHQTGNFSELNSILHSR